MKIIVVGVGALGSHLVPLLRNMKADVKIVDFDRVEQKNVQSQFHAKGSVGGLKVQSLKSSLLFYFGMKVETIPHKLTSDNDDQLLSGSDLVVDCLDNGVARRLVQGFVRRSRTACLHGALAPDGAFGRVVWDESFVVDDESADVKATCEDGEHLPFISIVSSLMAKSVQDFLKGGKKKGYLVHPGGVSPV
jgi:molybdopterin/thiamine biosynthesis adenylyltransferase